MIGSNHVDKINLNGSYHITIDVGTSSIKAGLLDEEGRIIRHVTKTIPLITAPDGRAEHDLELIGREVINIVRRLAEGFEDRVESIVTDTYLHGVALFDRDFSVVHNAMTHLDMRPARYQAVVERERYIYYETGAPPIFVYALPKILWLRGESGLWSRVERISFVKDYIAYKLTGLWYVDYAVASGSGMFNVKDLRWSSRALEIAGVDESMLPELYEGAKVLDYIPLSRFGLKGGKAAFILGTFDGAAQNIGFTVGEPEAVINLGSTAVIRVLTRAPRFDRSDAMRYFVYYAGDNYWAVGGASNNGMTFLEWFRLNVLGNRDWDEVERGMREVEMARDLYVLPFITGERFPYRDPYLRFTVLGGALQHDWRHIAMAAFESIAFILKAIVSAMKENSITVEKAHISGRGSALDTLASIIATALEIPIVKYNQEVAGNAALLGDLCVALRALSYTKDLIGKKPRTVTESVNTVIRQREDLIDYYRVRYSKFLEVIESIKRIYHSILGKE